MNHSKTMKNAFYEIENEFPYDCDVSSLNVWKLPKKQKNKILFFCLLKQKYDKWNSKFTTVYNSLMKKKWGE